MTWERGSYRACHCHEAEGAVRVVVVQLRLPVGTFVVELVASRCSSGYGLGGCFSLPKGSTPGGNMNVRRNLSRVNQRIGPLDRSLKGSAVDGNNTALGSGMGCKH
jgi:hypothetical protein